MYNINFCKNTRNRFDQDLRRAKRAIVADREAVLRNPQPAPAKRQEFNTWLLPDKSV